MEVKPLREYNAPRYPDKAIVHFNPNLLKTLPERWKGNVRIGIALSSLIMMTFTACGQTQPQSTKNNKTILNTGEERSSAAPLFVHGDGRGSFGCDSVAPPAFLSEEEAFQVVQEEAKSFKLELKKDGKTFKNIDIPISDIYPGGNSETVKLLNTQKGDLQLDGYDEKKHIGFEYISIDDFESWHKPKGMMSTVKSYNLIPAAETLRRGFEGNTAGNTIGVFYDPIVSSESINKKYSDKYKELSENKTLTEEQRNTESQKLHQNHQMELKQSAKEELKEQIKDFLNWLKAEGII